MSNIEPFLVALGLLAVLILSLALRNFYLSFVANIAKDEGVAIPEKEHIYGTCPKCKGSLFRDHVRHELSVSQIKKQSGEAVPTFLFICKCAHPSSHQVPFEKVSELRVHIEWRRLQANLIRRTGSSYIS